MASKSRLRNKVIMGAVAATLLIWVISAAVGAVYLVAPPDAAVVPGRAKETIALVIFAVTTTAIWLGVLVAVLVIAWKWSGGRQDQPPAPHS